MTKKVKFFNKLIRADFYKYISVISMLISVAVIFFDIPQKWKLRGGIFFLFICVVIYIWIWIRANKRKKIKLNIGGTPVWIKSADLFDQEGLKVIPFNEYYDTKVDDMIISHRSLNGQYIDKYWKNSVAKLNKLIDENAKLKEKVIQYDVLRNGKSVKYSIGSMVVINDYVLTAFSRFDENNCARLTINDYLNFLMRFWNEVNSVYAQKKVVVPIFGSGITRFTNGMEDIDENELLRIMIWTFKVSKIKFEYPADLSIIIHPDKIDKIDIFSLKEEEE
ncbi:TPA: macro domain-containing protein [Enterococcus faecium]